MTDKKMMGRELAEAVRLVRPGAQFVAVDGAITEWHSDGEPPTEAEIAEAVETVRANALIETYRAAVQSHIDRTARERGYESGFACVSYMHSAIPAWLAEAGAFVAWRDAVWTQVFAMLADVQAGNAAPPESAEALIASLPEIDWP
jgi:hypothetical protein